jgi:hypothetical protein
MENLPLLALRKIFNELSSQNELIRCSLVCKQWREAYSILKPDLLCMTSNFSSRTNQKVKFTNEKITKSNCFWTWDFGSFLKSNITRIYFENIEKLIVGDYINEMEIRLLQNEYDSDLRILKLSFKNQINYFKNLRHLDIFLDRISFEDEELNLPKLETLILGQIDN